MQFSVWVLVFAAITAQGGQVYGPDVPSFARTQAECEAQAETMRAIVQAKGDTNDSVTFECHRVDFTLAKPDQTNVNGTKLESF